MRVFKRRPSRRENSNEMVAESRECTALIMSPGAEKVTQIKLCNNIRRDDGRLRASLGDDEACPTQRDGPWQSNGPPDGLVRFWASDELSSSVGSEFVASLSNRVARVTPQAGAAAAESIRSSYLTCEEEMGTPRQPDLFLTARKTSHSPAELALFTELTQELNRRCSRPADAEWKTTEAENQPDEDDHNRCPPNDRSPTPAPADDDDRSSTPQTKALAIDAQVFDELDNANTPPVEISPPPDRPPRNEPLDWEWEPEPTRPASQAATIEPQRSSQTSSSVRIYGLSSLHSSRPQMSPKPSIESPPLPTPRIAPEPFESPPEPPQHRISLPSPSEPPVPSVLACSPEDYEAVLSYTFQPMELNTNREIPPPDRDDEQEVRPLEELLRKTPELRSPPPAPPACCRSPFQPRGASEPRRNSAEIEEPPDCPRPVLYGSPIPNCSLAHRAPFSTNRTARVDELDTVPRPRDTERFAETLRQQVSEYQRQDVAASARRTENLQAQLRLVPTAVLLSNNAPSRAVCPLNFPPPHESSSSSSSSSDEARRPVWDPLPTVRDEEALLPTIRVSEEDGISPTLRHETLSDLSEEEEEEEEVPGRLSTLEYAQPVEGVLNDPLPSSLSHVLGEIGLSSPTSRATSREATADTDVPRRRFRAAAVGIKVDLLPPPPPSSEPPVAPEQQQQQQRASVKFTVQMERQVELRRPSQPVWDFTGLQQHHTGTTSSSVVSSSCTSSSASFTSSSSSSGWRHNVRPAPAGSSGVVKNFARVSPSEARQRIERFIRWLRLVLRRSNIATMQRSARLIQNFFRSRPPKLPPPKVKADGWRQPDDTWPAAQWRQQPPVTKTTCPHLHYH